MSSATAIIVALVLSMILNRPGPTPGADAIVEGVSNTVQFSGSSTQETVSLSLSGDYAGTSEMYYAFEPRISASSSNNSGPGAIDTKVTSLGTGSITVQVDTETAPGSGESYTVEVRGTVTGLPAG